MGDGTIIFMFFWIYGHTHARCLLHAVQLYYLFHGVWGEPEHDRFPSCTGLQRLHIAGLEFLYIGRYYYEPGRGDGSDF